MTELVNLVNEREFPANILCIDQFANVGGGQRSLLDLLPALSERRWRPLVAVPGTGPLLTILQKRGYRTHRFAYGAYSSMKKPLAQLLRYGLEFPRLSSYFAELVQEYEIDLLYLNGPRLVPPAAWVAWRKGIPLIFHCHNRLFQQSAIALTGQALELASAHVIACCNYAAEPLREYVHPDRLSVIYNGVARAAVSGLQFADRIRRIGVVGRIEPEKGQRLFVQAVKAIAPYLRNCRFSIIGAPMFSGDDYYRDVVASSRELPIDFIDWQDDVSKIYSELDLLVVPSGALESTTRVILEAFSAGVPVVAFAVGGIPEVVQDGRTGFLAKAVTSEALAGRILEVVQMDHSCLNCVVRRAKEEWHRRFTLAQYRDSVCGVLARLMQARFQPSYDELRTAADLATD